MRSLVLNGPACVTYINWDSWDAFAALFDVNAVGFDPETETAARQRMVLDVIEGGPSN